LSPADRRLINRFRRRLLQESPGMARALLDAWRTVERNIDIAELARLIESAGIDRIISTVLPDSVLDVAFAGVRNQLQLTVDRAVTWSARDMPKRATGGTGGIAFNVLNPRHIDAIRELDTRVMRTLRADIRDVVREVIESGIRIGAGPRETARHIRELVGLAPNQARAVQNFRAALESGDVAKAAGYRLRDTRFALRDLTPARVNKMVAAYERRFIAFHAEAVSRTATLESLRVGNQLSWQDSIAKGFVPEGRVMKRWLHLAGQANPRPHHIAMDGETVPLNQPYSNGDMHAGEGDAWNCHCQDVIFIALAA